MKTKLMQGIMLTLMMLLVIIIIWNSKMVLSLHNKYNEYQNITCADNEVKNSLDNLGLRISELSSPRVILLKIFYLRPKIDKNTARQIAISVWHYCRITNTDPNLVLAIITIESNFAPKAISPVGAKGLMQVMDLWTKAECAGLELFKIDDNIKCGISVFNIYLAEWKTVPLALTAYNRGPVAVRRALEKNESPYNGYSSSVLEVYANLRSIDKIRGERL